MQCVKKRDYISSESESVSVSDPESVKSRDILTRLVTGLSVVEYSAAADNEFRRRLLLELFTKSDHFGLFITKPDHSGFLLQNRITAVQ